MTKYLIRAHYEPGVVRLGTVEAPDQNAALRRAEEMGLLDDKDAVDFTATAIVPPVSIDDRKAPETPA